MHKQAKILDLDLPPVENVEFVEVSEGGRANSTNSTNTTGGRKDIFTGNAVWPENSPLQNYVETMRGVTESEDALIIGSILPVLAQCLGRRVWIEFGGRKFANLYNILAGAPGITRKSTTFAPAAAVARQLLGDGETIGGSMSPQSFFEAFYTDDEESETPRIWMETEGNKLMTDLRTELGKPLAAYLLKTYDGDRLEESYMRNKSKDHNDPKRIIPRPLLSMGVAITPAAARMGGITSADGLRRRFNYYFSKRRGRKILWPNRMDEAEVAMLAESFKGLLEVKGSTKPSAAAMDVYAEFKEDIDAAADDLADSGTAEAEAMSFALSEAPSHALKRAMIFQACANLITGDEWGEISAKSLTLAIEHQRYCLQSTRALETDSVRYEVAEAAAKVLAKIQTIANVMPDTKTGLIHLTRSELTTTFCHHSSRQGSLGTSELYERIIPKLIRDEECRLISKTGKLEIYGFKPECNPE